MSVRATPKCRNTFPILTAIPLVASLLAVVSLGVRAEDSKAWSFGVLSQRSAVLTAQYWNPILDYVKQRSGVTLDLNAARTAPESNEGIEKGVFDFVYSNTIFLPKMAGSNYQVILRPQGEPIAGQIVTLEDSPIQTLQQLDGKEVGFPSLAAFVGYAAPMNHLLHQKITVAPVFGGNQEGIMGQLKAGKVIAAGVNSKVMKSFAAREGVNYRVLWESAPFNDLPIAVHPRVPKEIAQAVQEALDGMADDPRGMQVLENSAKVIGKNPPFGFLAASQADYQSYVDFYRNTLVKDLK